MKQRYRNESPSLLLERHQEFIEMSYLVQQINIYSLNERGLYLCIYLARVSLSIPVEFGREDKNSYNPHGLGNMQAELGFTS